MEQQDEIIIYQSQDGAIKVDVLFSEETVWLTQAQISALFGKAKSTISEHIKNIFEEGELNESSINTCETEKIINQLELFGNSEQPLSMVQLKIRHRATRSIIIIWM